MADELDAAEERMEFDRQVGIRNVQAKAAQFDKGKPGECFLCGEYFERVVQVEKDGEQVDACGGCRDKHGLK